MARNANELSVQQGEVLEVRMTLCEGVEEDGEQGRTGLRYSVWEVEGKKTRLQLMQSSGLEDSVGRCLNINDKKQKHQKFVGNLRETTLNITYR